MYRDSSTALDEHDRAVGALLIGEALIHECDRAWQRSRDHELPEPQRWRAIAEIHDTMPDVWRHLDRARRVLANRGINTIAYDEARSHARPAAKNPGLDGTGAIDVAALDDARRGLGELKLAMPGADWEAIEDRTRGLVAAPLARRRRQRATLLAGLALGTVAIFAGLLAVLPQSHPRRHAMELTTELELISQQRKLRIEQLRADMGARCVPFQAHELIRLLVQDGQRDAASAYGASYIAHCGDDFEIEDWAKAPPPPKHRR